MGNEPIQFEQFFTPVRRWAQVALDTKFTLAPEVSS